MSPANGVLELTDAVLESIESTLVSESDRGAVLVGSALLEHHLGELFRTLLPPGIRERDLLKGYAPLGAFSARAGVAYAVRFIDRDLYRAVTLVRRIRNSAAHSFGTFQLGEQQDRLKGLYELILGSWSGADAVARAWVEARVRTSVEIDEDEEWQRAFEIGLFRGGSDEIVARILRHHLIAEALPRFQFGFAIALMCARLFYIKNALGRLLGESDLVISLERRPEKGKQGQE